MTSDSVYIHICLSIGFPTGSDGKESFCNVGDLGSIPGLGRCPGGGHGNPPQYSCLENPHGQRSLEGYSLWGLKESDMTDLSTQASSLWFSYKALISSHTRQHALHWTYLYMVLVLLPPRLALATSI